MMDHQMVAEQQTQLHEATVGDIGDMSDITSISEDSALCLQIAEITAIMLPRGLGLFDDQTLVACWLFVLDSLLAQSAGASANSSCFDVGDVAMFHIWDPHS